MPPMGDYYEFKCTHETQIKVWWLNYSPNYVSITKCCYDFKCNYDNLKKYFGKWEC
jgi:hypothetical protein